MRGVIRRTGPRGISLRATGAWELGVVHDAWRSGGPAAVARILDDGGTRDDSDEAAVAGRAGSRSTRPVAVVPAAAQGASYGGYGALGAAASGAGPAAGGMGQRGSELSGEERVRRVLVHASGFRQSPYADIKPQGVDAADTRAQAGESDRAKKEKADAPSKLWHSSPGSSGW